MHRLTRILPATLLVVLALGACSTGTGSDTGDSPDPAPSRASPTPTAASVSAPDGSVLAGSAVLHDEAGAELTLLMVAEQTIDGQSGSADDDIDRIVAGCPGEYDSSVFDTVATQIMRVDFEVVAQKGSWDKDAVVALRPTAADSPAIGITGDGVVTMTGDGQTPHCRRSPTLDGAGSGHIYLVLPDGDAPVSWRSLKFGASDGGTGNVTFSACAFSLASGVSGTATIDSTNGCIASIAP